jgi:nicotinamidase/pyrazinamidase
MYFMNKVEIGILAIDIQNDFCPGGSLAVKEGDKVVEPINRILALGRAQGWLLAASRDWHSIDTAHFNVWPIHCVQRTKGAEFHPDLNLEEVTVFSKGMGNENDGYSPFEGVDNRGKGLGEFLAKVRRIYIGGLATDYCVKAAVMDAVRLGYEVCLLTDAIKAVNLNNGDGDAAIKEMVNAGAILTSVTALFIIPQRIVRN